MIEILKPDFIFEDDRGKLVQLIHQGYNQVNVINSKAGVKRGGHFHRINKEAFYIISGELDFIAHYDGKEEKHTFKDGDMFAIAPMVMHDFLFKKDTLLVSMYNKGVEISKTEKDIYTK